jgi:hypothetical protein
MSRCLLSVFGLSLLAIALALTGLWKGAGNLAAGLTALTMILALGAIINDSDKKVR